MNTRNTIVICMVAIAIAAMAGAVILSVTGNGGQVAVVLAFGSTLLASLGGFFMALSANQNAQAASEKTDLTNAKVDQVRESVNGHMAALIEAKTLKE